MRYRLAVACYCLTCAALHQILTIHYVTQCDTWLTFAESSFCSIVRKTLVVLRASSLLIAGAVVADAPRREDREVGQ